jgi:hypothetical protein
MNSRPSFAKPRLLFTSLLLTGLAYYPLFYNKADNENSWAKAIAIMRHGFGGHPFGEDDHIKKERAEGQIEGFYKNVKN